MFGASSQNKPAGLFGATNTQQQAGGGLFGNLGQNAQQPQPSGGGLFGNQGQAQNQPQQQQQGGGLFGQTQQQAQSGLFGNLNQNNNQNQQQGGFGQSNQGQQGNGLFGLGQSQNNQQQQNGLFNNSQQRPMGQSTQQLPQLGQQGQGSAMWQPNSGLTPRKFCLSSIWSSANIIRREEHSRANADGVGAMGLGQPELRVQALLLQQGRGQHGTILSARCG